MKTILLATFTFVALGLNCDCFGSTYSLSGLMDPNQATTNPSNVGNGSGVISGDYDDAINLLNYSISWENLTSAVTNMHFHVGAPGVPGGIDLGIPSPFSSPEIGTNVGLSASQEINLLSGNWYVNIHTVNFGGGEIRGQVIVTVIPEPTTVSLAAIAGLSLCSLARRRRLRTLDP